MATESVTSGKAFLIPFCLIPVVLAWGSCSSAGISTVPIEMEGMIVVVGNHPFESVAIEKDDGTIIRIQGKKELLARLTDLQGKKVVLTCSPIRTTDGIAHVIVSKFIVMSH